MDIRNSEVEAAEISAPSGQSNLGHSTVPLSTLVILLDWESAVFRSPILLGGSSGILVLKQLTVLERQRVVFQMHSMN